MKSFDIGNAAQAEGADSTASYFSGGLLSRIIHSDQKLARPTEHVLRRRWVNRMILAEIGFVIGVALLQFFPVIEDSSAATAQPTPTATIVAPTATAEPSPEATQTSVISATTIVELPQPARVATQAPVIVPVALPNTGSAGSVAAQLYVAPLLCIGGGLALWLVAGTQSVHDRQSAGWSDDEGSGS